MLTAHPYSVPSSRSALLSAIQFPTNAALARNYYEIENMHQSENAWLLFTRHTDTNKHIVIKILSNYKDTRYNLKTIRDRQLCQLEGLRWNRMFTHGVHIGLARLCDLDPDQKRIGIGEPLVYPTKRMLDPKADYGLLMHELRKEKRLDCLLKEGDTFSHQYYVQILAQYMAYMHTTRANFALLPGSNDNGMPWGSIEQLKSKLLHNFSFINQSLMLSDDTNYYRYYKSLKDTFKFLKEELLQVFVCSDYQEYFEQRRQKQYIRRCHGDLKARNIWIDLEKGGKPWKCVSVLDAIDFNPMYSNIDILSDFAMLVIDIQARTKSSSLANLMVEDYLRLTTQQDKPSRAVLTYYLVEKAFVGAIINIIYDNLPDLGLAFLEVAEMCIKDLKSQARVHQTPNKIFLKESAHPVEPSDAL